MATLTSVDVEGLLSQYLRSHPAVTELVSTRVYTDLPHHRLYPLVLISRTGGVVAHSFGVSQAQVRIEAYDESHMAAHDLAALLVSVCEAGLPGPHELGCVSAFETGSLRYEPDPEAADGQGHARPRYVIEASVHCHP